MVRMFLQKEWGGSLKYSARSEMALFSQTTRSAAVSLLSNVIYSSSGKFAGANWRKAHISTRDLEKCQTASVVDI